MLVTKSAVEYILKTPEAYRHDANDDTLILKSSPKPIRVCYKSERVWVKPKPEPYLSPTGEH